MRRYWLSILLSVFIIVGIGTYYLHGTTDYLPEYKLTTIEGNVNEGARIQLSGAYIGGKGSSGLTVTNGGSEYSSRESLQSFFRSSQWFYEQTDIRQMINDHRSFMRAKGNGDGFYKDDEWIIYAEAVLNKNDDAHSKITLQLDLLHQQTGEVRHYTTVVDEQMTYDHVYVTDVQLINDQIHILTNLFAEMSYNNAESSNLSQEYHDYVVDMNNGTLSQHEILNLGMNTKEDKVFQSILITNGSYSSPSDYSLFIVREDTASNNNRNYVNKHLYSYAYKTGELTDLSEMLLNDEEMNTNVAYYLNNSVLITQYSAPNLIELSLYNLDIGKVDSEEVSITAKLLGADKMGTAIVRSGRLFTLFYNNDIPMAAVIDVTDGNILYKGEVIYDGEVTDKLDQMKNIVLLNMAIVE